jgi:hypothetical protein
MIFSHRVTPVFAVVVGCLIPVPGAAVTFVLWCTCCSFFSGRATLHSACACYVMLCYLCWHIRCELVQRNKHILRNGEYDKEQWTTHVVVLCQDMTNYFLKLSAKWIISHPRTNEFMMGLLQFVEYISMTTDAYMICIPTVSWVRKDSCRVGVIWTCELGTVTDYVLASTIAAEGNRISRDRFRRTSSI